VAWAGVQCCGRAWSGVYGGDMGKVGLRIRLVGGLAS
jgi:hypothetical protein